MGAYYAHSRGRSFWAWYVICFFLPVISFFILIFLPDKSEPLERELQDIRIKHGLLGTVPDVPRYTKKELKQLVVRSKKSEIRFDLHKAEEEKPPFVQVLVNGTDLLQLIAQVEQAHIKHGKLTVEPGNYQGLPPEIAAPPSLHLLGHPHEGYHHGQKVVLYADVASGIAEDWGITAEIAFFRRHVVWHNFQHTQHTTWSYRSLPPLVFGRMQYEEALSQLQMRCFRNK